MRMVEMGVIQHLETYHMPEIKYCPLNLKSTERQLTNADLSLTYKVVTSGFVLSIVMFIIEMLQRCCSCEGCLCCTNACPCCRNRIKTSNQTLKIGRPPPDPAPPKYPSPLKFPSPPRPALQFRETSGVYETIYSNNRQPRLARPHIVNGRDYFFIKGPSGERRLVPARSPSALLFQYTS